MRTLLTLLALSGCLLGAARGLRCFACRNDEPIAGISLSGDIRHRLDQLPSCRDFDVGDGRFVQECDASGQSCFNATDKKKPDNQLRTCFPLEKDECIGSTCYCTRDMCNAGARVLMPVAVVAAMLAALLAQ